MALVNAHTPIYFGRAYSKIIDLRTVLKEEDYEGDAQLGVFIDIWPLDNLPNNPILRIKQRFECRVINSLYYNKILKKGKRKFLIEVIGKFFSKDRLLSSMEKRMQRYRNLEVDEVICFVDPYNVKMKKEWFTDCNEILFEKREYFCPTNKESILAILYGNYMQLPPLEKRVPPHLADIYWK